MATTKKAAKKAKPAITAKRERHNNVTRPRDGSLCAKVWDTLYKLRAKGERAVASAAMEALKGEKIAQATVRTQTQRWREFNGVIQSKQ